MTEERVREVIKETLLEYKEKKDLKIIQISCVYNEIDFLPNQIKYIKSQGLDVYVIDNYSTDGTWEWLQENKIPSHQLDTNNMFDLSKNHAELTKTAKKLKADWIYFADGDLFPVSKEYTIREFIEIADSTGHNTVFSDVIHMFNTGEKRKGLFDTYFYGDKQDKWLKIVKSKYLKFVVGDGLALDKYKGMQKIIDDEIVLFNFGMTKEKHQREETLKRREKAWENGLNRKLGRGFTAAKKQKWRWKKDDLTDVRKEYNLHFDNLINCLKDLSSKKIHEFDRMPIKKEDIGLMPHFEEMDAKMFYKYLDKCKNYFEFGSGGSTYQAAVRQNIEKIYSIESDKKWIEKVKNKILRSGDNSYVRIRFLYKEMQTPSNSWGHPGINATKEQMINYSNLKNLTKEELSELDLVLIDGRFRVACCLKCHNLISDTCFIIFDDFLKREHYHIVLDYFDIVEMSSKGTMVVLQKKKEVGNIDKELIKKYELQTD